MNAGGELLQHPYCLQGNHMDLCPPREGNARYVDRACEFLFTALPRLDVWNSGTLTRPRWIPSRSSRLRSSQDFWLARRQSGRWSWTCAIGWAAPRGFRSSRTVTSQGRPTSVWTPSWGPSVPPEQAG